MALRFMPILGCRVKPSFYHLHNQFALRGPLNKIPWSPSSSSSSSILHRFCGSSIPAPTTSVKTLGEEALCGGGTSIYEGAQKDEWIIVLAKFAVNNRNENQLWRNFMELLVWKPVAEALSAVGVKRGDLKLHEAVMFYMNQRTKGSSNGLLAFI